MKNLFVPCLLCTFLLPALSIAQEPINPARAAQRNRIQEINQELNALNQRREQLQREKTEQEPRIVEVELEMREREIERIRNRTQPTPPTEKIRHDLHEAQQRIEHMAMAREHLMAAGLPDLAQAVAEHSEHLERRLHHAQQQHAERQANNLGNEDGFRREIARAVEELTMAVQELREENQRIRRELSENRRDRND